jgi:hypothetical protein
MDNANLLIIAMADQCRAIIRERNEPAPNLPKPLQPKHLERMCDCLERHAEDWSATRLHRWIGFVQCAMMANRMLDLDGARAMFDKAKVAHGEMSEDLLDHLDPTSSFELDLGGEG